MSQNKSHIIFWRCYELQKARSNVVYSIPDPQTALHWGNIYLSQIARFWNSNNFLNSTTVFKQFEHPKVSFFSDQSQHMSSRDFLPKNQASDLLTYLVYQLKACFFAGIFILLAQK